MHTFCIVFENDVRPPALIVHEELTSITVTSWPAHVVSKSTGASSVAARGSGGGFSCEPHATSAEPTRSEAERSDAQRTMIFRMELGVPAIRAFCNSAPRQNTTRVRSIHDCHFVDVTHFAVQ